MYRLLSESELIEKIGNQDKEAFRILYDRYARLLDKRAKWRVRDMVMVEDLTQEFWIRVWEDPSKIQTGEDGTVKDYLLKSFTGYQLNYLRKELIRLNKTERYESKEDTESVSDTIMLNKISEIPETSNFSEQYDLQELINWYFDTLPELIQQVLRLRHLENYSYKDIAKELNLNERTVRYKEKEGLILLRTKMKDERLGELLYSVIILLII